MDEAEIRKKVAKEMDHITLSAGPQSILRAMYWVHRIHSLEEGEEDEDVERTVLMGCIEAIRGCYHNFDPLYDKDFFG